MVTKSDIERTLSKYPFLNPPDHVYVLDAPILVPQLQAIAKGMEVSGTRSIFLTPLADEETVVHETIHTYGLGELATYPLAKILKRFRQVFPPIVVKRKVEYEEREIPVSELRKYGLREIPPKTKSIKLYVLKK